MTTDLESSIDTLVAEIQERMDRLAVCGTLCGMMISLEDGSSIELMGKKDRSPVTHRPSMRLH